MKMKLFFLSITASILFSACKSSSEKIDWKKQSPGATGITLDMPYELIEKKMSADLQPSVMQRIKRIETFFHEGKNRFYGINMVEYVSGIDISLPNAVKGALSEMARKSQGKVVNQTDRKQLINGREANITTATLLNEKKIHMDILMLLIPDGNRMYQVVGMYESGKESDKKIAERIIQSVEVKG
jgi:hypothetical protein